MNTLFDTTPATEADTSAIRVQLTALIEEAEIGILPLIVVIEAEGNPFDEDGLIRALRILQSGNMLAIDGMQLDALRVPLSDLLAHANCRVRCLDAKQVILWLHKYGIKVAPTLDITAAANLVDHVFGTPPVPTLEKLAQDVIGMLRKDRNLLLFYQHVLHPAILAIARMEITGVAIDLDALNQLRSALMQEIARCDTALLELLPAKLESAYWRELERRRAQGRVVITPDLLAKWLYSPQGLNLKPTELTNTGKPSTTKDALAKLRYHPHAKQIVDHYSAGKGARTMLATFVDGFRADICRDGRLHPTYHMTKSGGGGTVTGRLSAQHPAIQTIPHKGAFAEGFRRAFTAPAGYRVFSADYAQGELRVIAEVANETNMLQAFADNLDLHCVTAAKIHRLPLADFLAWKDTPGKQEEFQALRNGAKAANFGLLYGMGAEGFAHYATNYGLQMSSKEAQEIIRSFYDAYPALEQWKQHTLSLARKHGYVQSPLGRIRYAPNISTPNSSARAAAERALINAPIQSTLSDITLMALCAIQEKYGQSQDVIPVAMVHDAIWGYARADRIDALCTAIKATMESIDFAPLGWQPRVAFTADISHGATLNDCK